MTDGPSPSSAPSEGETVDVFVSYAHADDEVPTGAERGWVTTLVGELQKVLRRKLGAAGARVWMDHRLAANQNVTEELLDQIRTSRTLLLVMSPGYQKSEWCQRELANYVARASARGKTQSVFPIEIEPVNREAWHPALKSLTPIKFWHHEPERAEPKLAGYPVPKPDEDSLYWDKVNSLAHLVKLRLEADSLADAAARKTAVVLAETTDDLDVSRQSLASALRQRGDVVVLPVVDYPRATEQDFLTSVRSDLKGAALFVQLMGRHIGRNAPGSARSFVSMQTQEALRHGASLRVMQWRPPELDLDSIVDQQYRELLSGQHVELRGIEARLAFDRHQIRAADRHALLAKRRQIEPSRAVMTTRCGCGMRKRAARWASRCAGIQVRW